MRFWNNLFGKKKIPEKGNNLQSPFMPKKKDPKENNLETNSTKKKKKKKK